MQLVIASDHAGYELKESIRQFLEQAGHKLLDLGSFDPTQPDDYPDYSEALGVALQQGRAERGILICGSGVGASVAANKLPGIRAGLCHDHYSAHQGVEHDNMNVLVLGSRIIGIETAKDLCVAFLAAEFSGEDRHVRRLAKIHKLEENPPRPKVG